MVAIAEETTNQDTRGEWITFKDEWETDHSEDDGAPPPNQAETLDSRDEWVTEDY